MFFIQIIEHDKYVALAAEYQTKTTEIIAKRGEIYFRDGEEPVLAAMNVKVWTVILDPQTSAGNRTEIEQTIGGLAKDYLVAKWDNIFSNTELRYYVVARNVPYEIAQQIKDAKLPGVWMQANTKRAYPEGTLGANILGFVNSDGIGQYGTEGSYNDVLAGKNGTMFTVKDVNDIPLTIGDKNVKEPATDGSNIVLTIDRNIQNQAEKAVRQVAKETGIANANAIVMDPRNGEILAIAQTPSYDPANYGYVKDASVYQIDAFSSTYDPASVCKTFAFAAAINEGKMTPETKFNNVDEVVIDGWTIGNAYRGMTGNITMQTAFDWSLNMGSIHALKLLGGDPDRITEKGKEILFDYYYNRFHLGQYTGIGFSEADGTVWAPGTTEATDARYANMTFGQSLSLTTIQVISAFSAIVNGGTYYRPTLYAGEYKDGKFIQAEYPEGEPGKVTAETSKTMREMLYSARVIYVNAPEFDQGAYVGAKTGTAQVVTNGAYSIEGDTRATYVGFGAKSKDDMPEYVIMTRIWEDGKTATSYDSKKIFDLISKWMIRYKKWK
ncbi:MAG: penicillin-binding protein 2 [Candidatus Saccharibacteria bacterium]|nr:penicillin-binding protein 2 [Candidatus Saccharibacteria bacterium]